MLHDDLHPSDQELLLAADGELSEHRAAQVRLHLAACWDCRARSAELETTIVEFARTHRQTLDSQLPPIAGPRSILQAKLAELSDKPSGRSWRRFIRFTTDTRIAACICAAFFVAAVVAVLLFPHSTWRETESRLVPADRGLVPDPGLTPGATRPVAVNEICSMDHEDVIRGVPMSLREEVFKEYGIVNAHANDYEIDYLIAPGLGGTEDIRNLWPESYTSSIWNAHVKDDLEEHLHQLVCSGRLNLSTAQHDIATDWIAAYKKYFHTDRPLAEPSDAYERTEESVVDCELASDQSLTRSPRTVV